MNMVKSADDYFENMVMTRYPKEYEYVVNMINPSLTINNILNVDKVKYPNLLLLLLKKGYSIIIRYDEYENISIIVSVEYYKPIIGVLYNTYDLNKVTYINDKQLVNIIDTYNSK